jgi:hypothetical protein
MTNKAPFCAFLWLTLSVLSRQIRSLPNYQVFLWSLPTYQVGPRNLRNPRSINDLRLRKLTYEIIKLFLQNEPNFRKSQMNITDLLTKEYEKMDTWSIGKNEPKRTQNEPNLARHQCGGTNPTCSELACPESSRRIEPISVLNNVKLRNLQR